MPQNHKALYLINELRKYSDTAVGTTRLSYSDNFLAARDFLRDFMKSAGMTVHVDALGNLIGTYEGLEPELPAVWSGSHLDSVPSGGAYDGVLGIVLPLACIAAWHEQGYRPRHSVSIIAFVEEEGTLFSMPCIASQVLCGEFADKKAAELLDSKTGQTLNDYLLQAGLNTEPFTQARLDLTRIKCFLEAHIEQGEELDLAGLGVGIVSSIVGIDRYELRITGQANHAGTTRMSSRRDAMVAAAYLTLRMNEAALASQGEFVATVGRITLSPNAVNVVPGAATVYVETRAANEQILNEAKSVLYKTLEAIKKLYAVECQIVAVNKIAPVQLNKMIMDVFAEAAEEIGLAYKVLPSWAGHDAKVFAEYVPTGMLFVPSVLGISHAPEEYTADKDINSAYAVLDKALRSLADE